MTGKPRRFSFDREGRVMQSKPKPAPKEPKRRRPGIARKYLTATGEQILHRCYPGEVPAAVIERALRLLVERDGRQLPGRPS